MGNGLDRHAIVVSLKGRPQNRQLLMRLQPSEALVGLDHAGGDPSQGHDDDATIVFWHDLIVCAGGVAKTLEPVCESLYRGLATQRDNFRENYQADFDTDGLDLKMLS